MPDRSDAKPHRRKHENGVSKYLRWWPLVLFAIMVIAGGSQLRYAVAEGEKKIEKLRSRHSADTIRLQRQQIKRQEKLDATLRKQAEVNGRIDARTEFIKEQLDRILRRLGG